MKEYISLCSTLPPCLPLTHSTPRCHTNLVGVCQSCDFFSVFFCSIVILDTCMFKN